MPNGVAIGGQRGTLNISLTWAQVGSWIVTMSTLLWFGSQIISKIDGLVIEMEKVNNRYGVLEQRVTENEKALASVNEAVDQLKGRVERLEGGK